MKNIILERKNIILAATIWWFCFVELSILGINSFQVLNIVGFLTLVALPGILTVAIMRIRNIEFWGLAGLVAGLSIFELMALGLLGNTFLPMIGIAHPLARGILLLEFSFLVFSQLLVLWIRKDKISISVRRFLLFDDIRDFILAFIPAIFVIMSVLGAIRLNNGGDGAITLLMLIGIAVYSVILIRESKRIGPNVVPTALFFIALALLFMTSLRGWYITGHDVQREFNVFELTKYNGIWSIAIYRDAYNACMSITILPTFFYNTLKIPDHYVYKVLFQIIFAIVPSVIYLTVRRYTTSAAAFLSILYFISFPTFFGDMPMLNRQEIAFLYLALIAYSIFETNVSVRGRQILFVMSGLGIVLSHYSTTYTVIAIMLFLIFMRPVIMRLFRYLHKKKKFPGPANDALSFYLNSDKKYITSWMVGVLMFASFLWSSVLTDTSSNSISRVIMETIKVIQSNSNEETKSGDVLYSLFSWRKFDANEQLDNYNEKVVQLARTSSPSGIYYDAEKIEKYPIKAVTDNIMPLTSAGRALSSLGFDVFTFNYIFRQTSAKLLQVFIIIGFIFIFSGKNYLEKPVNVDYILMAAGSMILVLSQVVLPVLSVEYGLLRAFQQALFFLGIFIVLGSFALLHKNSDKAKIHFASAMAIAFFLSSTGVFTQILGGYGPQLHLNNDGAYYDIYYLHDAELAGISWLEEESGKDSLYQSEIHIDRFTSSKVTPSQYINVLNDIYPGLIRKDSYVYLGFSNVKKRQTALSYNGNSIIYHYPVGFLEENKNLIYNNGGVNIYK